MQVSFQSKLCLAACTLISAYSAYSNPKGWLTSFVIGVLMGTYDGYHNRHTAEQTKWPDIQGQTYLIHRVKELSTLSLARSMPGWKTTTLLAINCINEFY